MHLQDLRLERKQSSSAKFAFCSIRNKNRHEATFHSEEKNYECQQCPKAFANSNALKAHEVIHGEKLYKCQFCDKSFHNSGNRKRHEMNHTGDLSGSKNWNAEENSENENIGSQSA